MSQSAHISEHTGNGHDTSQEALKDRAVRGVEDSVDAAQQAMNELSERASTEFQKATKSSTDFVRANPGTAIAGAVGVGILVGLLLRGTD